MVVKFVSANPYTIGIFRLAVATLVLGSFMAVRGELRRLPLSDVRRLAAIGMIFFAHWITLFLGIKASTASIGAIGLSTYGVDLLILGWIFGHERPSATDVLAVAIAASGAILVVPEFNLGNDTALGMLLCSISAVLYASLPLLHQRSANLPTSTRALGQFGFALALFLLFLPKSNWDLRPIDWGGLLFLGVGVTLIGHSLWVRVTTALPTSTTSIIYYANIPIAVALGVIVLGEPLTTRTAVGAALIIGGSIFGLLARRRRAAVALTA